MRFGIRETRNPLRTEREPNEGEFGAARPGIEATNIGVRGSQNFQAAWISENAPLTP